MKTLKILAVICITGSLLGFGAGAFAGDNLPIVTLYDLDLAKPTEALPLGPKNTPNWYCGALNMLMDATMWTIPMSHDAAQGNAGMFTAVVASACR